MVLVAMVAACDPRATVGAAATPLAETSRPAPASAAVAAPVVEPMAAPSGAKFVDATEVVSGISVATHTVISPPRTGDKKEDYWTQYMVYGEITNHSTKVFESMSAQLTFHGKDGAMLGVESIGTLSAQDAGDFTPGESIYAEVHFVQPGQTVPFFFTRNLAAVDGDIAFHKLYPKRAMVADDPPHAVALDVVDGTNGKADFERKRTFSGTIRNDGEGGCRYPEYVVAFRDAAGKIASIDRFQATDDLKQVLAKGESLPFAGGVYVSGENAWRETAKVEGFVDCQPIY